MWAAVGPRSRNDQAQVTEPQGESHGLVDFDATNDAVMQCPYPHYRAMRDEAPVLELDGAPFGRADERLFAVSRHEDVKRILHDPPTARPLIDCKSIVDDCQLIVRYRQ